MFTLSVRNFRFIVTKKALKIPLARTVFLCGLLSGCATYRGLGPLETAPRSSRPSGSVSTFFSLQWPLNDIHINRGFNVQKRRPHLGIDLAGVRGTGIFAAHPGKVIYAGRAYRGYGRMVMIEYSDQWATLYAHLDSIQVHKGDTVAQGQLVGRMGRSGHATGVHLHFELFREKTPVDPLLYLNKSNARTSALK